MAPLTQVFVRTLDGRTRCLNFERDDASHEDALTLRHLRRALESSEGVPASEQLIRVGGLVLGDGDDDRALRSLSDAPSIDADLLLRINGGKGGFGSLLRGSKSAQTTTNFDVWFDATFKFPPITQASLMNCFSIPFLVTLEFGLGGYVWTCHCGGGNRQTEQGNCECFHLFVPLCFVLEYLNLT